MAAPKADLKFTISVLLTFALMIIIRLQ